MTVPGPPPRSGLAERWHGVRRPRRLRATRLALLVLVLVLLSSAWGSESSPFVSRSGTTLIVEGAPWRFTGYNDFSISQAPGASVCGDGQSDEELARLLDRVRRQSGANVVRTWFFQSMGGPGRWEGFDRLLAMARASGLRVVPTLVNQWSDCEPGPVGRQKLMAWYQGGYTQAADGYERSYRDFAVAVAARYADDPTVAFWQLVNESEAPTLDPAGGLSCDEAPARLALRGFADLFRHRNKGPRQVRPRVVL